ncbi:MAG: ABC transporter permease, partial [bacterium]|nr:ABC transporter permease [bacterium]
DRPAEHVGEQQQEHDRLDGRLDDQLGQPQVAQQIALGDDDDVADRARQRCRHPARLGWGGDCGHDLLLRRPRRPFGAGQTALGLTEDLAKGVIDRFRSLPMARSAVLAGRTFSDLIRNGFVIGLMLAVGFLIGFRYQTSLAGLVGGMALAMVFSFAFSWIMATIGLLVKNTEAVQPAVFISVFPLVFASSVFVPTQTMPSWLRTFADNQPVTVTVDALRGLILGEGALLPGNTVTGQVLLSLFYSGLILAVFVPLAIRTYRRTVT